MEKGDDVDTEESDDVDLLNIDDHNEVVKLVKAKSMRLERCHVKRLRRHEAQLEAYNADLLKREFFADEEHVAKEWQWSDEAIRQFNFVDFPSSYNGEWEQHNGVMNAGSMKCSRSPFWLYLGLGYLDLGLSS